jgi:hypothetical protein
MLALKTLDGRYRYSHHTTSTSPIYFVSYYSFIINKYCSSHHIPNCSLNATKDATIALFVVALPLSIAKDSSKRLIANGR